MVDRVCANSWQQGRDSLTIPLGATYLGEGRTEFLVWAPKVKTVDVHLLDSGERLVPLEKDERDYHHAIIENAKPGTRYFYRLDGGTERPDPASRLQPQGVHGPSEIVDPYFAWQDQNWSGLPLQEYIIYELHVGAFTPEGTLDAAIRHLEELKQLGITAIELMPLAQFPGSRNWGYDGVYPFAVQNSYGGPAALKGFVAACHRLGLAVILDVVYNHLGPEGNYVSDFGPYFTERYRTPWGPALNLDGPYSDEVRRFLIENALTWISDFHIDALRLDAIHAIVDPSARPFLEELGVAIHAEAGQLDRHVYVIPESDRNDSRVITSRELGGYGLDAQWNDDFHHALHTLVTAETAGYYQDFGKLADLVKAYREGYVYSGQYSSYRQRRHGNPSAHLAAQQFVVFAQNHDQVGNRMLGDRLSQLVPFEALKALAGAVLLSPFIPLLFMGEEYGETAPFLYFVSHGDADLIEATRKGRQREFVAFRWQGEIPDPQAEATFLRSKLRRELQHGALAEFYKELIRLRRSLPALASLSKENLEIHGWEEEKVLLIRRGRECDQVLEIFNFATTGSTIPLPLPRGRWRKVLDSKEARWKGHGTCAPDELESQGEIILSLPPHTLWVFDRPVARGS
jgi:maltooligosyltrehalose trehalohydrolase